MFDILQPKVITPVSLMGVDGAQKKLPGIYAIEVTSACDLACPMCLRGQSVVKKPALLDFKLLQKMLDRGDFAGSSYIELQMSGEPTIHPRLLDIIMFLKYEVGVMVGLSTHGLNMMKEIRKPSATYRTIADVLMELDALTISVDSVNPDTYHEIRYPAYFDDLEVNLEFFFANMQRQKSEGKKVPFVETQLVVTGLVEGSGDAEELEAYLIRKDWRDLASVRTVRDCFTEMSGREPIGTNPRNSLMCLNPFLTVNISQDGDVVSCCYIFDTNKSEINFYGNLHSQSLEEIWNGPRVAEMRLSQMQSHLSGQCEKCYYYSPILIHQNIVSRLVQHQRKQG